MYGGSIRELYHIPSFPYFFSNIQNPLNVNELHRLHYSLLYARYECKVKDGATQFTQLEQK